LWNAYWYSHLSFHFFSQKTVNWIFKNIWSISVWILTKLGPAGFEHMVIHTTQPIPLSAPAGFEPGISLGDQREFLRRFWFRRKVQNVPVHLSWICQFSNSPIRREQRNEFNLLKKHHELTTSPDFFINNIKKKLKTR
jgi:hypothetical protein